MARKTLTVQFSDDLIARIDEASIKLAKQGIFIKRSATIRLLIERALKDKKDG